MAPEIEVLHHGPPAPSQRPPILFVHGAFMGAWVWQGYWMPYFAQRGWACYALSLRGHGGTPGNLPSARIRHYVEDVTSVARTLPAPPILIGHSMGGFTVQKYLEALDRPARAAVLVAPVPHRGAAGYVLRHSLAQPAAAARELIAGRIVDPVSTPPRTRWTMFSDDMIDTELLRWHTLMQAESSSAVLDFAVFDLPRTAAIRARGVPMLVVAPQKDTIFSPGEQSGTARAYGADFRMVPGAHTIMLDTPWQTAADAVLAWLNEKGL